MRRITADAIDHLGDLVQGDAARSAGVDEAGRARAAGAMIPRGEMSIVLATVGSTVEPELAPLGAAYVLILAISGTILMRYSGLILRFVPARSGLVTEA